MQDYCPPLFLSNGHLQTIYPSLFRKLNPAFYNRERINTPDNDFLDLDWSRVSSKKIAIISHGMEGSSHRHYVIGMAKALNMAGWDVLAWNFRSCSGEINRKLRFYHSGTTDDLQTVIDHVNNTGNYQELALVGFSMGGNQILVYLGEQAEKANQIISKACVFSVPCHLKSSAEELARFSNKIYMKRFLKFLHQKIKIKMDMFPGQIDDKDFQLVKTFKDFDDRYTSKIHGFKNAEDYWKKCSSKYFIPEIKIPTLIVNSLNDPFLAEECYPHTEVDENKFVCLETPKYGGHVGFVSFNKSGLYYSEQRAIEFLNA
ncbi:MAG: alpha/beta fold hydrolase [Calditrichaeota bacterium]|nr:MAG: alpha/beta fold hydrolase [Calditrichota bacterium]MBL1207818.1 alpha/beta fold hydrolase [Calditrichota bacterium]NOG47652.1 alpha/beta fold hydrolase [Calditrichota bacterium]